MGTSAAVLIAMSFLPCASPVETLQGVRETVVEMCPDTVRMLYSVPVEPVAAPAKAPAKKVVKKTPKKKKPATKRKRVRKRR